MCDRLIFTINILGKSNGDGAYRQELIEKALISDQGSFEPLFSRLIDMGDSRLTVIDDSLEVGDISLDNEGGIADVTFQYYHYMGCKDMNTEGDYETSLEFEIRDGVMLFDIILPPAWRPE